MKFTRQSKNLKILQCRQLPNICQHSNLQENRKVIFWDAHYYTDHLEFNYLFIAMQIKFSLQPIISILYICLGIILPPCFCCTGEYKSLFKFLRFLFLVSLPQNNHTNYIRYLLIKVNNLKADNPLYLSQNVFYLINTEALTVPCSVVKHARDGSSTKEVQGEIRDVVQ